MCVTLCMHARVCLCVCAYILLECVQGFVQVYLYFLCVNEGKCMCLFYIIVQMHNIHLDFHPFFQTQILQ